MSSETAVNYGEESAATPQSGDQECAQPQVPHADLLVEAQEELGSRYELRGVIGRGAFGVVFAGVDTQQNNEALKPVAVKRMALRNGGLRSVDILRLSREITVMSYADHPCIVRLRDVIIKEVTPSPQATESPTADAARSAPTVFLVSDLMSTDLHRVIYSQQPLTEQHVKYILFQILHGLEYLHEAEVVHRDIKPSNILINANCRIKLCDLGLSRAVHEEVTATGPMPSETKITQSDRRHVVNDMSEYVCTRWYRAPELVMPGGSAYSTAIDIWAAGCVAVETLMRRPLFRGASHMHQLQLILDMLPVDPQTSERIRTACPNLAFRNQSTTLAEVLRANSVVPVGDDFIDLLLGLFTVDPSKRLTATQAMKHPAMRAFQAHVPTTKTPSKLIFQRPNPNTTISDLVQQLRKIKCPSSIATS